MTDKPTPSREEICEVIRTLLHRLDVSMGDTDPLDPEDEDVMASQKGWALVHHLTTAHGDSAGEGKAGANVTDAWRKPPPHFKPDPRWQRQPQSDEEWDAQEDEPGKREFRAKRRLAFAGDLADPRAPECMALVSRLDISVLLSRLTWLEARFENTRDTALPPVPEPIASVPVTPAPQSHEDSVMFDIAIIATSHQPDDAKFSISFKDLRRLNATIKSLESRLLASSAPPAAPLDMILHCPKCGLQHVDAPGVASDFCPDNTWTNPPHRSHLCHGCGLIWRPADVPTNGVAAITTKGKNDSPPAAQGAAGMGEIEEIAKRHAAVEAGHKLYAESGRAIQAVSPQVHDDRATLLAFIRRQQSGEGG